MSEIIIRVLTAADAGEYKSLRLQALRDEPEAFGGAYEEALERPLSEFEKQIEPSDDSFVLGAFNGAMIGTMGCYRHNGKKLRHKATIWGVYVAPEGRGKGIARALMQELISKARAFESLSTLILGVATHNEPAYKLYRSFNFEPYGLERDALRVNGRSIDEHLLELRLTG